MLAFLAARGVPVVVLAAAAAADALAAAVGGTFAPALTARFGGVQLARLCRFPSCPDRVCLSPIGTLISCPGSEPVVQLMWCVPSHSSPAPTSSTNQ